MYLAVVAWVYPSASNYVGQQLHERRAADGPEVEYC